MGIPILFGSNKGISSLRILPKAVYRIRQATSKQHNQSEIGGLLIGIRVGSRILVLDVTIPNRMKDPSMTAFDLDAEMHMTQAAILKKQHNHNAEIIGVWHTHICETDFSRSDHIAHRAAVQMLGEICSLLVVTGTSRWRYKAVCIDKRCNERHLPIVRSYG